MKTSKSLKEVLNGMFFNGTNRVVSVEPMALDTNSNGGIYNVKMTEIPEFQITVDTQEEIVFVNLMFPLSFIEDEE